MRKHTDQLEIKRSYSVDYRFKFHFKPSVIACKSPGLGIEVFAVSFGNIECHLIELVSFTVIKKHIFACRRGVAETVTDVEAEATAVVEDHLSASPVPGVVVSPDSPAPIKCCKRLIFFVKLPVQVAEAHLSFCTHAVDLLIIVKMLILVKRSCNYHAFLGNVGQSDVKGEELA